MGWREGYLKDVRYILKRSERPWETTKRITQCREDCLVTYTGMWPANQWPLVEELGWFLSDFLAHILAGHNGSCFICDEWQRAEGEPTHIWPSITVPAAAPFPVLTNVRLVERSPWEVSVLPEYTEFDRPGERPNDALRKSFPRLTVYGRYGVEQIPEEKHDG